MNEIIGGAIAAVIGAVGYAIVGLYLEHRRDKAKRLTIVDALITETEENLTICETYIGQEKWCLSPYRLEAYHAYKGELFFLPEQLRVSLVGTALIMETCNGVIQTVRLKEGSGQSFDKEAIPPQEQFNERLKSILKELQGWKTGHTGFLSIFH